MKTNTTMLILAMTINLTFSGIAQTWDLLIPPNDYDVSRLNFSNTAFDQKSSTFYSVYKTGSISTVQSFNLSSNTVSIIPTTNQPPVDLFTFTYDYTNKRLIANRAGRENLYAVSINGGAWTQIGTGSNDAESYGGQFFWNSSNNSLGFFGGYGYFSTHNWVWENNKSWYSPYRNNTICDNSNPAKRNGFGYALGAPNSNKIFIFSGMGNCSGNQRESSCSLGSPWATDIGIYCWLKDLWQLDLTNHTFKNILPVNSSSISKEGQIIYDYMGNTFYILGGYVPSPTYISNYGNVAYFETKVLRYRVGIDNGFMPFTVEGTPPPLVKVNNLGPNAAYFDAVNNQIVWARKDGIWAIKFNSKNNLEQNDEANKEEIQNEISLNILSDNKLEELDYTVFDGKGNIVMTGNLKEINNKLNISKLSSGEYRIVLSIRK